MRRLDRRVLDGRGEHAAVEDRGAEAQARERRLVLLRGVGLDDVALERLALDEEAHEGEGLEEGLLAGEQRVGDGLERAALVRTYDGRVRAERSRVPGAGRAPVGPQSKARSCVPGAPKAPIRWNGIPEHATPKMA